MRFRAVVRRKAWLPLGTGVGLVALVAAALAPAAGAAPGTGGAWQPNPPSYGASAPATVSVRMDDGTQISAEVVYPTNPATGARATGRFPVLLTQNPYGT
jgi:hypothetical protein